jgi:hypothetical protein
LWNDHLVTDQSVQTPSRRRVVILRQVLLGTLVAVLVFVPDDQLAIRVAAGLVVIAVFWLPPVVRIITNFREGYRGN